MYPINWNPDAATTTARQRIDEQIREAGIRRIARDVRRARQAPARRSAPRPCRERSFMLLRRAFD